MRNGTIRLILILAILSAVGIIGVEAFWVKRAYNIKKREVNLTIITSLHHVAYQLYNAQHLKIPPYNVVDKVTPKYYIVGLDTIASANTLEHLLQLEFEKNNFITDFQIGLYDKVKDTITETHYVHMSGSTEKFAPLDSFPPLAKNKDYFSIYFPHKNKYIASNLTIWIYSSVGLFCVLLFLGYVVFIILKQKRLSEVQKDFINNMTHEFKTPLTSIQLSAKVLSQPNITERPQRLLNYATIINNEAAHLSQQVERVLQMNKNMRSGVILNKGKIDLKEVIKEISVKFKDPIDNKNGILTLKLPNSTVMFIGDRLHLKNVISNLVDNALKYSKNKPKITISLKVKDSRVIIRVKDSGIGISEEHKKMIFKKFYRIPTGNVHDAKGFGLGLNYVSIITKAHGGKVVCESQPGTGSVFSIILPHKKS